MSDEGKTVAGRTSLADVMRGWDTFVHAVESLPVQARNRGPFEARSFARTHLHALIDQLSLTWGRTKEDEINQHRVHAALTDGIVRSMLRSGPRGSVEERIGMNARMLFVEVVEGIMLRPTLRVVFERSREDQAEEDYIPETGER